MREAAIILAICACLGVPVALAFVSQATLGVAIIGGCCLLAILARLCQAAHHQRQVMTALYDRANPWRQP